MADLRYVLHTSPQPEDVTPPPLNTLVCAAAHRARRRRAVSVSGVALVGAVGLVAFLIQSHVNPGGENRLITGSGKPSPCELQNMALSLEWERRAGSGELVGTLSARGGDRPCTLSDKPRLVPLDEAGRELEVLTFVTDEARIPVPVLESGGSAAAPVSWNAWCGQTASRTVRVTMRGRAVDVAAKGIHQPTCQSGETGVITSGWFTPS